MRELFLECAHVRAKDKLRAVQPPYSVGDTRTVGDAGNPTEAGAVMGTTTRGGEDSG
jgi:hypothetical protein